MDQYIGKMLDNRYEILECIGTGGMAVVYKARCHRLNRLVAVKILKPELAQDAEFRRRFHDESQAVAMLSHTNIVAVYDVSHSDGLDYIVMELIDGMTLKQYMRKRGAPLGWREAVHFITQIARALSHAHGRGIVHRDIKPQNILVLRDGSVKVTDFGIARVASAAQSTLTQEALGSVHYISPEQARGSHIDGRSDIYSAGVVLYEMLTGRLPFEGETPVSVAIQHINSIPIPPRDLNDSIPPALEAIVLKAMSPKAETRYASADEMLADLEEFRKNPDVMPAHTQQVQDESAMSEATRVVPVSEIKAEQAREEQRRSRSADAEHSEDTPPNPRIRRAPERPPKYEEEYYDEPPRRGGFIIYVIAVIAILAFVGGMFFVAYNLFFSQSEPSKPVEVEVPNLTSYTWEQLESNKSLYEGFALIPEYEENEAPAGTVLRQDPVGGSKLGESDQKLITVTVSSGSEKPLTVPPLDGKKWAEAAVLLREMGLYPVSENENSSEVKEDYVIRTSPQEGSSVRKGDAITVFVSVGEEKVPVSVPSFKGMNIEDAKNRAEQLGLVVGDVDPMESNEKADTVIYQSLPAETDVLPGSKISFWYSLGPKEPDPSEEPSEPPSEPPDPSDSPDVPPGNTTAVAVTKTISIDLRPYSDRESVRLKIVVGGRVWDDKSVLTASVDTYSIQVAETGEKLVEVYVDDKLLNSYTEFFN